MGLAGFGGVCVLLWFVLSLFGPRKVSTRAMYGEFVANVIGFLRVPPDQKSFEYGPIMDDPNRRIVSGVSIGSIPIDLSAQNVPRSSHSKLVLANVIGFLRVPSDQNSFEYGPIMDDTNRRVVSAVRFSVM